MKKMILPFVAILLAGSLSAFTTKSRSSDDLFYWFEQTGTHDYVGSTNTPDENPLGCKAIGSDCVKGYQEPSQPLTEPARQEDQAYAFD